MTDYSDLVKRLRSGDLRDATNAAPEAAAAIEAQAAHIAELKMALKYYVNKSRGGVHVASYDVCFSIDEKDFEGK